MRVSKDDIYSSIDAFIFVKILQERGRERESKRGETLPVSPVFYPSGRRGMDPPQAASSPDRFASPTSSVKRCFTDLNDI